MISSSLVKFPPEGSFNAVLVTMPLSNSAEVNFGSATSGLSPTIFGTLFFLGPDELPLLIAIIMPAYLLLQPTSWYLI